MVPVNRLRRWTALIAVLILGSCGSPEKTVPEIIEDVAPVRRFNVVLVTIDTLRADRLGCYGYSKIDTPNLDKFAQGGVLFENAIAQAPLTAPSHASMMTGLYPTAHKVRDTGGFVLDASYATLATILQGQGWDTAAFVGASVLRKSYGFNRGFGVYDDEMPKIGSGGSATTSSERRAGDVVNRAVRWLDSQGGKPFFLWVHVYDPHLPYDPPSPFREKYKGRPYDAEVAYTDQQLGTLLKAVAKKAPPEETVIAVLSDHGESLTEHGEYTHGVFLYDSTLRIPFMVSGPGVPANVRVKQQVRTIDLLPTLLDVMGRKAPQPVQGLSLLPAFKGKRLAATDSYLETLYPKLNMGWAELRGIRTERWKYIRAPKRELYDLVTDPTETSNVIESHRAESVELDAKLKAVTASGGNLAAEKVQTAAIDQRTMQELKSLGYTGASSQASYVLTGKGVDPKDRTDILKDLHLGVYSALPLSERMTMLRRAVARDPSNPTVYSHLGDLFERSGRYTEAMQLYRDAIDRGIQNDWLYTRLGYLHLGQGDRAGAIRAWEAASQLNPSDYETIGNLAMAYLETGRIADAERVCKWILKTDVDYPPAHNHLGIALFQKGDLTAARTHFEKALQLDPTLLEAELNLGRISKIAGDNAGARKHFKSFLAKASPAEYGDLIPKVQAELSRMQ